MSSGLERVERKLAAIFCADVADYSRLMHADEVQTVRTLTAHRAIMDGLIAQHGGRIANTAGDSVLAEFPSVVDAVECAVAVQEKLGEANAGVSDEKALRFRIGVHVGDVMVHGGDLLGDGVNVAARVQALADPGGVWLSGRAYEEVEGKIARSFQDRGEQQVKNIARPVRVYALAGARVSPEPTPLPLPDKPSIAVLPFLNMSGDPEQDFFAHGTAEDIITALSRFRWLFVIARNSSFVYQGRAVDVKQVSRELGVRFVLEGSVRKAGERVRVTTQLLDGTTGTHLWAERYDRKLDDVFAVQDEITREVAMAMEPALAQAERERVSRKRPESLDAWEMYHRGLWHFLKNDVAENETAKVWFRRALELDAGFAPGQYGLTLAGYWNVWYFQNRPLTECAELCRAAQRAVEMDDADATAHMTLGFMFQSLGDVAGAHASMDRALSLNPNHAWAMAGKGELLGFNGDPGGAVRMLEQAMRASPHDPLMWAWLFWLTLSHYYGREYEAALAASERLIRFRPDVFSAYRFRAASLAQLGRTEEAQKALRECLAAYETAGVDFRKFLRERHPWHRPADFSHLVEGLRLAGLPE